MGYSEILCKLCGVSFNISRMRREDEPYYAAWSAYESFPGDEHRQENFISIGRGNGDKDDTLDSDGCQNRTRRFLSASHDTDDEDDGDYIYQDEADSEPLEYVSDEDGLGCCDITDDKEEAEDRTTEDTPCSGAQIILSHEIQEFPPSRRDGHKMEDAHGSGCKSRVRNDEHKLGNGDDHGH